MSLAPGIVSVNENLFAHEESIFVAISKLISQAPEDKALHKFLVVLFRYAGATQRKLAKVFSYTERHIRNIERAFEKKGALSFQDERRSGRPTKIRSYLIRELIETTLELVSDGTPPTTDLLQKKLKRKDMNVSQRTLQKVVSDYGLKPLFRIRPAQLLDSEKKTIFTRTSFGGFYLLIPFLIELYKKTRSFGRQVPHLLFTLIFSSLCGMGHLFHLKDVEDRGFALLVGKKKVPDDSTVWKWMRSLNKKAILKIYQLTRPLKSAGPSLWISIDEHVVPRWTQIFGLKKTHHPTRGRKMRADKLFYAYELAKDTLLSLSVSPGNPKLSSFLLPMVGEILSVSGAKHLRIIFDAGGCKGSVLARLKKRKGVTFLTKAVRYSTILKQWEKVDAFAEYTPPEDRNLPEGERRCWEIANCRTKVKGCRDKLRTVLLKKPEEKGKERFCGFFTNDEGSSVKKLADEYPLRFRHESCYRVMVHDLNLDLLPKSYSLDAKDRENPNFLTKRLFLTSWLKAYAYNLMGSFKAKLPFPYTKMRIARLVRKFLFRKATLKLTSSELHVILDPFKEQNTLSDYCRWINKSRIRIPWLGNRILKISFAQSDFFSEKKVNRKLLSAC